jgi:SAM-dependent methyltransferase
MKPPDTESRERREIDFWSESESERPGEFSVDLVTHKLSEARVFLEKLAAFRDHFEGANVIVELGGGQCWTSCIVKRELGATRRVFGTDIAPDAVVSVRRWEALFDTQLDGALATRSYATPFRDGSVDLVFVFAAAHHFGSHRRTLGEIARILRPGGVGLYLHEPGCRDWIYPVAYRRVMAKRPVVPEDVLRYRHIASLADEAGLDAEVRHAPTTTYRGAMETVYYLALQKLRPLQDVLPCSVDIIFRKRRT